MKIKVLLFLSLFGSALSAEELDSSSFVVRTPKCAPAPAPAPVTTEPQFTYWDVHPLHIGAESLYIGKAGISNDKGASGHLHFHKNMAFLSMIVPVCRTIIFIPRFEYSEMYFDWNKNPKFSQKNFSYLKGGLILYTNELDRWEWIVRADYNMDTAHFFSTRFALFNALLWGKYELFQKWHYHVGATGYVGLEGGMLYPIIGLDYKPNKNWIIKLIFPIMYSVEYHLGKYWHFELMGRPLKERFRINKAAPQPESVFSYSSIGAEANIRFEIPRRLEIVLFGGCNFGGNYYIKDQGGHNPLYTDVGAAPYIGGKIDWGI